MSSRVFRYRVEVIEQLWRHGAHPAETTPPELARNFVRDLYKYEIRRLRERLLRNEFPRHEYGSRVEALRRSYPVLSLPAAQWVE